MKTLYTRYLQFKNKGSGFDGCLAVVDRIIAVSKGDIEVNTVDDVRRYIDLKCLCQSAPLVCKAHDARTRLSLSTSILSVFSRKYAIRRLNFATDTQCSKTVVSPCWVNCFMACASGLKIILLPRVNMSLASLYSVIRLAKCKANLYLLCFDNIKAVFSHLKQYNAKNVFWNKK